jgi:predicted nucleic acid-binding protein
MTVKCSATTTRRSDVIVLDASALTEMLSGEGAIGEWVLAEMESSDGCLVAEHTRIEVVHAIRGKLLGRKMTETRAKDSIDLLGLLELETVPTQHVISRVWELRSNITAYDAAYVAIAEQNRCPLVTTDLKLVAATGPRCEFRSFQS